jgi:hypothetical protein
MAAEGRSAEIEEGARVALADLLNRVLDRGVVITGTVTISVADIDLIQLGLNLYLTALEGRVRSRADRLAQPKDPDADVPVLPAERRR